MNKYKRAYEAEQNRLAALRSPEARKKMSDAKKGKTPSNFLEAQLKAWATNRKENLTYNGIHAWVRRNWGKANRCEMCGKNDLSGRKVHWANKDHKYSRNRSDWMQMCRPCHSAYDRDNNGVNFSPMRNRK